MTTPLNNKLFALTRAALLTHTRIVVVRAMRYTNRVAATLVAAVGLMVTSLAAHTAVVNVVFTNLGAGNQYLSEFEIKNDGAPADISGFTIYFSESK